MRKFLEISFWNLNFLNTTWKVFRFQIFANFSKILTNRWEPTLSVNIFISLNWFQFFLWFRLSFWVYSGAFRKKITKTQNMLSILKYFWDEKWWEKWTLHLNDGLEVLNHFLIAWIFGILLLVFMLWIIFLWVAKKG